ncbi:MAG: Bestrophin, chloride channel [Planctomycetota bacterium]|nr:Bestrophin, chloride channel [Planctomycetota bacterium]
MRPVKTPYSFWIDALRLNGSAAWLVFPRVAMFGVWALILALIHWNKKLPSLNIEVAPFEAAGAALGLLLVLRTNAGYDRWWEGRKLWGGITNASRSLAISATAFGPDDPQWRGLVLRRIAAFAHVCRRSLRGQRDIPEVVELLGPAEARMIAESDHMPTTVARLIAIDVRAGLGDFAFLQADAQRVALIDYIGGCERILKSPLPLAYAIEVRRFIFLFLITLPFVLFQQIDKSRAIWLAPLVTVLVAYPLLAIDKIGHELQEPFFIYRLNHLSMDEFTSTIERNVLALEDSSSLDRDAAGPIHSRRGS